MFCTAFHTETTSDAIKLGACNIPKLFELLRLF